MSNNNPGDTEGGMESVNRVARLPLVESTVSMASDFYSKVKESHEVVNSVLSKAEETVRQAVDMSKPVTDKLETPLKKVDSILCSGLDFVETNVPAIKLPPQQMYENTKNAVVNTVEPAMKTVYSMSEQSFQKVSSSFSSQTQQSSQTMQSSSSQTQQSSQTKHSCCLHKDQPCPPNPET